MAQRHKRHRQHRRGRTPAPLPTLRSLAEADGAEVDDLLREVSEFRLALETDLTIAAAAADAAAEQVASDALSAELTTAAVDAGRSALDDLVTRHRLDPSPERPQMPLPAPASRQSGRLRLHRRYGVAGGAFAGARAAGRRPTVGRPSGGRHTGRRLAGMQVIGVGPLVAVAVVLGVGTGFFASQLQGTTQSQGFTDAASTSLHSLSDALGDGNDQAAREAGNRLNAAIGSLIAAAPGDPAAATAAASALIAERAVLATASGALGEQLRASMAAQVVALQATVHTPIATLVIPTGHLPTPARLTLPVPLPSTRLPSALASLVAVPSLPGGLVPTHRLLPSRLPDPDGSVAASVPSSSRPSAPAVVAPRDTSTPTPAVSPTPALSATPTAAPSTPASSPSAYPLPLITSTSGQFFFPH